MSHYGNLKWRKLSDFTKRRANITAHCFHCCRSSTLDADKLATWFQIHCWNDAIEVVAQHLYCVKCRRRPSRLRPSSELPNAPRFFPETEDQWKRLVRRLRG